MAIYGSDEATTWVWNEYHPELPGKRHRVVITTTGYFGTLIRTDGIDGDELKLVTEGAVFRMEDELRGSKLEVGIAEPQKVGTERAVKRWNEAMRQTLDEQTADVAGSR